MKHNNSEEENWDKWDISEEKSHLFHEGRTVFFTTKRLTNEGHRLYPMAT